MPCFNHDITIIIKKLKLFRRTNKRNLEAIEILMASFEIRSQVKNDNRASALSKYLSGTC